MVISALTRPLHVRDLGAASQAARAPLYPARNASPASSSLVFVFISAPSLIAFDKSDSKYLPLSAFNDVCARNHSCCSGMSWLLCVYLSV